jgi:4,5-DOPA dioxygenase extradiol
LFPKAEIPVVQLSLAQTREGQFHYDLGKALLPLRDEGILVMGSGNIVHNLRMMRFDNAPHDWAVEFDAQAKKWIDSGDHAPLIHFQEQGKTAALSINSAEHYLPLLYILALRRRKMKCVIFANPHPTVRFQCWLR